MRRTVLVILVAFAVIASAFALRGGDTDQPTHSTDVERAPTIINFSGYDWQVKTSRGSVGPGPNVFGSESVRVDKQGYLHLGVIEEKGHWLCGEVILASDRGLGFGEYRFVIQETAGLDVNAVLGLFLWDPTAPKQFFRELDAEVSRWGDALKPNAQFVVMPYTRPENLHRFELNPGKAEVSFRWSPGELLCRARVRGRLVQEHVFTKGVPGIGPSAVRANLWLYRGAAPASGKATEVVIQQFKFVPLTKGDNNAIHH